MVPSHSKKIGDILRDMGVLTTVDMMRILLEQKRTHEQFGKVAISWGLANPDQISEAWARQLSTEQRHVDLEQFGIDPLAVEQLSPEEARKFRALPLRCWGAHLVVAIVSMPLDGLILEEIAEASGRKYVYPCFCSPEQLDLFLDKHYTQPAMNL